VASDSQNSALDSRGDDAEIELGVVCETDGGVTGKRPVTRISPIRQRPMVAVVWWRLR